MLVINLQKQWRLLHLYALQKFKINGEGLETSTQTPPYECTDAALAELVQAGLQLVQQQGEKGGIFYQKFPLPFLKAGKLPQ